MSVAQIDILRQKYEAGLFPHALLVSGGTETSRRRFAKDVAILLLGRDDAPLAAKMIDDGNLADLIWLGPDGGSIKVEQIRDLIERLRNKPFLAERTLAVIEDGDLMNTQAQNKLLKTLEEPPGDNVIIILAANTEMMRATIRSRCLKMNIGAEKMDIAQDVNDDAVKVLSVSLFGKPSLDAFAVLDNYGDDPFPLLDAMELFLRDIIVGRYAAALVPDEAHREIASKMKDRQSDALRAGVGIIEDTRAALRFGRMNKKSSLRDMALRLRGGKEA
ncbi:MAG: hypothetical protein LBT52_00720 [Clostridiales Family XIII bacterium]|nr:hypothetical protein [Clostridiales Family XIII bacterium]